MATPAQCAYCFEVLSAHLEKRKPLSLDQVSESWDTWATSGSLAHSQTEDSEQQIIQTDAELSRQDTPSATKNGKKSLIGRLLAPSPSSTSSSSGNATPNSTTLSESSSRTSLSTSSLGSNEREAKRRKTEITAEYPLFVTWNTLSRSGDKRLRGCIGTFEAQELEEGLRSYALTAALEDHRFSPISTRELSTLDCGITLLTDFEPASHTMDWDIGKHGIRISFTSQGRRYGATYLPDVAREQGWTKEETITSLMRKAGWNGRKDDWKHMPSLKVTRYQGHKESLDYQSWKDWRDWTSQ